MRAWSVRSLSLLAVIGTVAGVGFFTASPARSQLGVAKNYVQLQASTPGAAQSGHGNLSGTMRAGAFVGDGSGLTGLPSSQITLPMIRSQAHNGSLQGLFDITNTSATPGTTAVSGTATAPNSAGITGTAGGAPGGIPGTVVGVFGQSNTGNGVLGFAPNGVGIQGSGQFGVRGLSIGANGIGVVGSVSGANGFGVDTAATGPGGIGLRSTGTLFAAILSGNNHLTGVTTVGPTFIPSAGSATLMVGDSASADFEGIASVAAATGLPFFSYVAGGNVEAYTYYQPINDTLRFFVGSDRMAITNTGNVGIGVIAPTQRLHVEGGQIWSNWSRGPSTSANLEITNGLSQPLSNVKFGQTVETGPGGGVGTFHLGLASYAQGATSENRGLLGSAAGISTGTNIGVYGLAANGATNWAGYFNGPLFASSSSAGVKAFLIDHPDDPENMYLEHSSIESNERMNLYRGRVVTDGSGYATVTVPSWFASLNGDIQYQLTVIDRADRDDFVMAKVVQELDRGAFRIRTSAPNTTVCWQLSGVRIDPVAKANPLEVEREKPAHERGKLLFPEAYGRPASAGLYQQDGTQASASNARPKKP